MGLLNSVRVSSVVEPKTLDVSTDKAEPGRVKAEPGQAVPGRARPAAAVSELLPFLFPDNKHSFDRQRQAGPEPAPS